MLKESFTNLEFFWGLLATMFFGFLASKLMRYIIRKYEVFPAPEGIAQTNWENAFNSPRGVLPINRIIGFMESIMYFITFSIGKPELIGGWLAFKVASKWQSWSTILKIPEKIDGTEQLAYIGAKNIVASHTLQRWLIGNISNILAGLFGLIAGIWIVKIGGIMDILQNVFDKNLILLNYIHAAVNQAGFKNSLLYFYSTIDQSMAALFAISGIFLIFRLEMINSEIRRGIDNFRDWVDFRIKNDPQAIVKLKINVEPHSWLEKDVRDHIEEALKEAITNLPTNVKALTDYFGYINCRLSFQTTLKVFSYPPFIIMGALFIYALYCLVNINILDFDVLYSSILLILFWTCILVIYLMIFIFFVILGPRDVIINNPKTNK